MILYIVTRSSKDPDLAGCHCSTKQRITWVLNLEPINQERVRPWDTCDGTEVPARSRETDLPVTLTMLLIIIRARVAILEPSGLGSGMVIFDHTHGSFEALLLKSNYQCAGDSRNSFFS